MEFANGASNPLLVEKPAVLLPVAVKPTAQAPGPLTLIM